MNHLIEFISFLDYIVMPWNDHIIEPIMVIYGILLIGFIIIHGIQTNKLTLNKNIRSKFVWDLYLLIIFIVLFQLMFFWYITIMLTIAFGNMFYQDMKKNNILVSEVKIHLVIALMIPIILSMILNRILNIPYLFFPS